MSSQDVAVHLQPQDMLSMFHSVNIAAPMVRYSKSEFSRSANARMTDFSTSVQERGTFTLVERWPSRLSVLDEKPSELSSSSKVQLVRGALIAQFAANDPQTFADAVELIHPYVDGVDLNCGCPQGWAFKEQIGCWLLREPDRVRDLIRASKDRISFSYPISIKIRVDDDLKRTEQLIQTAIHAGVSHITVHGRTRHQASTIPVSLPSIAFAVDAAKGAVPIIANGDAWSLSEVNHIREKTKAQGVMSARGLLANPALFSGHIMTPPDAVQHFVHFATDYGLLFPLFHRHLCYMLEARFVRNERKYFNTLGSFASVVEHLQSRGLEFNYS